MQGRGEGIAKIFLALNTPLWVCGQKFKFYKFLLIEFGTCHQPQLEMNHHGNLKKLVPHLNMRINEMYT